MDDFCWAAALAALFALLIRWRRADGIRRQQLKFLVLAFSLVIAIELVHSWLPYHVAQAALTSIPWLLIGAVVLAVLRYRLYDIDLVIRRTAVFAAVSALVFTSYLAVAAALGANVSERAALAGGGEPACVAGVAEQPGGTG